MCDGDPADREAELLIEQDALDYELGMMYLDSRNQASE